jgi:hypothetical protein
MTAAGSSPGHGSSISPAGATVSPRPAILLREETAVRTRTEPALGWTVVLRRQPVRIVGGDVQGGYADAYELICCSCGDHPDLDYRDVSPELQRIRGPYSIAAGIAAYATHVNLYHGQQPSQPVHDASGGPAFAGGDESRDD